MRAQPLPQAAVFDAPNDTVFLVREQLRSGFVLSQQLPQGPVALIFAAASTAKHDANGDSEEKCTSSSHPREGTVLLSAHSACRDTFGMPMQISYA